MESGQTPTRLGESSTGRWSASTSTKLRFGSRRWGLYLLSIELDPNPRPVDKLRFEDLRGTVLHRVKGEDEEEGTALGSLGPLVGEEHKGRYDLVIGNPLGQAGRSCPNGTASVKRSRASRRIGGSQTQRLLCQTKCSICPSCGGRWNGRSRAARLCSRCTRACSFSKATGCRSPARPCSKRWTSHRS